MRALIAALAVLPLAACGGKLNPTDTKTAFSTMSEALSTGSANAAASASGHSGSVDFMASCTGGGSMEFKGSYNVNSSGPNTFSYDTTFSKCSEGGTVMDGALTFALDESAAQGTTTVAWKYDGDVAFSGKVNGDCPISLVGNVSAGSGTAATSYSGTVCGQSSAVLASATY